MIGITNVGGGGGMAYAYIGVIYDAGATVTCTDGNKTYRAKDTSGLYTFPVPYAATWIVTATDGTKTKSESVVITSLWQDVVADMTFWNGELFDNGRQFEFITGGWAYRPAKGNNPVDTSTIDNHIRISRTASGKQCFVTTGESIDLTGVESITITYEPVPYVGGRIYLLNDITSSIASGSSANFSSSSDTNTEYIYTLDNISRSYYIGFMGSYDYGANVSKVKLNYS